MHKIPKLLLLLTVTIALTMSGCSIVPGMYFNESRYTEGYSPERPKQLDLPIIPVSVQVVKELQSQQALITAPVINEELNKALVNYQYYVGPQDILSVTVWDHPELTIPQGEFRSAEAAGHLVQSDGTIFFPYVGVVDVAGKTLEQIRQVLTERIKTYINNPQLDVRVAAFRSQKVQVMGEVTKPSVLPITDIPLTALDAINQVGGATKDADLEHVTLTRNGHVSTLNIQALYDYGDMTQNILLQNGDILQVSDKSLNQVFILGEVQKPASYLMNKGRMSLAEAVGATGGFNETTVNPSRIYVIRGEYDKPKIYRLDASSPDALLLATQFPLKPKDVVYVASTDIARWNRIIQQILPTIQTLWQTKVLTQ